MALNTMADLSTIVANNVDVIGQPALGSADANNLDAVDRSTLALLARFYGDIGGAGTVGGSADAITLTSLSTYQALEDGLLVSFKAGSANTGAATLNLDGLGAKAIRRKGDAALEAGDIAANGRYDLVYDAAYNAAAGAWVLMNPESVGAATTSTLTNKTLTSPTINTPTLILKQSAAPTPTAEGDMQWDTDDNIIIVGDGSGQKLFYPVTTGTWTPTLLFGGASTGITYATQTGNYTKVGSLVTVAYQIVLSSKGSASGTATISGLPFAAKSGTLATLTPGFVTGMSSLTAGLAFAVNNGASVIDVYRPSNNHQIATDAHFTSTSQFQGSGSYITD